MKTTHSIGISFGSRKIERIKQQILSKRNTIEVLL
jgi:hypothetical protein